MHGEVGVVTYFIKSLERYAAAKCFPSTSKIKVSESGWKISFFLAW